MSPVIPIVRWVLLLSATAALPAALMPKPRRPMPDIAEVRLPPLADRPNVTAVSRTAPTPLPPTQAAPSEQGPQLVRPASHERRQDGAFEQLRELSAAYWKDPAGRAALRPELDRLAGFVFTDPNRTPRRDAVGAIIDRDEERLTVHVRGHYIASIPCDVRVPAGLYTVSERLIDPVWYGPDGVVESGDPMNPLGGAWIGLSDASGRTTGCGLHGTPLKGASFPRPPSCARLEDAHAVRLTQLLTDGATVEVR